MRCISQSVEVVVEVGPLAAEVLVDYKQTILSWMLLFFHRSIMPEL
jgi:hypothetical protein